MNEESRTRVLSEVVIFSALSVVLYLITLPFLTLPFGGSVTLGSMVPIMWLSLRRGKKTGFLSGAVAGLIMLVIDIVRLPYSPIAANPASIIFDYILAYGALCLVDVFRNKPLVGVVITSFIKFLSHFISGVIFWGSYASWYNTTPIPYSLIYNGSFMTGETIIALIIMYYVIKRDIINIFK